MASNYPGSLDSFTNPAGTDALTSPAHAAQHADANDAIEAIESTLGVNPQGTAVSVAARLTDIQSLAGDVSDLADAAAASAASAAGAEVDASNAANLAEDWAIQLVDPVSGGEYSSKFHAQAAASSASAAAISASVAASGVPTGGGSDLVFYENDATVTTSYSITATRNAMSAGPITINTGATVTVPVGSVWVIT